MLHTTQQYRQHQTHDIVCTMVIFVWTDVVQTNMKLVHLDASKISFKNAFPCSVASSLCLAVVCVVGFIILS